MKNTVITVLLLLVLTLAGIGCAKKDEAGFRGEWKIVSVNLPKVLAEKDGKRKVFNFPAPFETAYDRMMRENHKVEVGWIIQVENSQRYHFFPPPVKR